MSIDEGCELCHEHRKDTCRVLKVDAEEVAVGLCPSCDTLSDEEVLKEYVYVYGQGEK